MSVRAIIEAGRPTGCQPWPRYELDTIGWLRLRAALADEPGFALLGLWGEAQGID